MQHVRIFTAVNLSVASLRRVAELQQRLHQQSGPELSVAWVPPANLHLTMKFYGNLAPEQVEAVRDAAHKAASQVKPFGIAARGLGVFPDPERPRVLWVGLAEGTSALGELARLVEDASFELGFPRDPRPFRPHMTIARIRGGNAGVADWLAEHGEDDFLASTVEELVVYESRLRRSGAEYIAHARLPLGAPA